MTSLTEKALILQREICCRSLLELEGFNVYHVFDVFFIDMYMCLRTRKRFPYNGTLSTKDWLSDVSIAHSSGCTYTENISSVFGAKIPFSNLSGLVWTWPMSNRENTFPVFSDCSSFNKTKEGV